MASDLDLGNARVAKATDLHQLGQGAGFAR
jgi:hypothetical protein